MRKIFIISFSIFSFFLNAQSKFHLNKIGVKIEKPSDFVLLTSTNIHQIKKDISGMYNYCENSRIAVEQALSNPHWQVLLNNNDFNETITFVKVPFMKINIESIDAIKEKIQQECYSPQNISFEILDTREGVIKNGNYISILFKINAQDMQYYAESFYVNHMNSTFIVSFNSTDKPINSIKIINSIENINSPTYDKTISEFQTYYDNKDINNALLKLSEAIKLEPENSLAYEKRIGINLENGKFQEVISDANEILSFDSLNVNALLLKAVALSSLKQHQESIDTFIIAEALMVLLSSANVQNEYIFPIENIFLMKGEEYQMLNQLDEALEAYNNTIEFSENDYTKALSYSKIAHIKSSIQNNYSEAIEIYSNSINLYSHEFIEEKVIAYFNRATNYNKIGEYKKAIQDLSSAIKLKPDYGKAYLIRGQSKCTLEDYKGCKEDCNKFLSIDKSNDELKGKAYFFRGMANLMLIEDYAVGCRDIREAKKLGENIPKEILKVCN